MKKELQIVLSVLAVIIFIVLGTYYSSNQQMTTTIWQEKDSGEGPWKMQTGSREEEEQKQKEMLNSYEDSKNIKFKEHPSDHEVIFTKSKGTDQEEKFHQTDKVPEVKY